MCRNWKCVPLAEAPKGERCLLLQQPQEMFPLVQLLCSVHRCPFTLHPCSHGSCRVQNSSINKCIQMYYMLSKQPKESKACWSRINVNMKLVLGKRFTGNRNKPLDKQWQCSSGSVTPAEFRIAVDIRKGGCTNKPTSLFTQEKGAILSRKYLEQTRPKHKSMET